MKGITIKPKTIEQLHVGINKIPTQFSMIYGPGQNVGEKIIKGIFETPEQIVIDRIIRKATITKHQQFKLTRMNENFPIPGQAVKTFGVKEFDSSGKKILDEEKLTTYAFVNAKEKIQPAFVEGKTKLAPMITSLNGRFHKKYITTFRKFLNFLKKHERIFPILQEIKS